MTTYIERRYSSTSRSFIELCGHKVSPSIPELLSACSPTLSLSLAIKTDGA
jgi:hypothetical protein